MGIKNILPELMSRLIMGIVAAPADYRFTGPILVCGVASYGVLRSKKVEAAGLLALQIWFGLMFVWWVFRFCLVIYPNFHLA